MLDALFDWMNMDVGQVKVEDVLKYEVPNRDRKCSRTPIEFLKVGTYLVEIQDIRKSISQAGRPYFVIEMLVLESTNAQVEQWMLAQDMCMLDTPNGLQKSLKFLRDLLETPSDLTASNLHHMLSDQDEDNWNSPFAGVTMKVEVKEQVWEGGRKTMTKYKIFK